MMQPTSEWFDDGSTISAADESVTFQVQNKSYLGVQVDIATAGTSLDIVLESQILGGNWHDVDFMPTLTQTGEFFFLFDVRGLDVVRVDFRPSGSFTLDRKVVIE